MISHKALYLAGRQELAAEAELAGAGLPDDFSSAFNGVGLTGLQREVFRVTCDGVAHQLIELAVAEFLPVKIVQLSLQERTNDEGL